MECAQFPHLLKRSYVLVESVLKQAKRDKNMSFKKEISLNMLEIASSPNKNVPHTMNYLLKELEYLATIAEKKGVLLCPLGTYPGTYEPVIRNDLRYQIKKSVFGEE